jgi:hypothetical protein
LHSFPCWKGGNRFKENFKGKKRDGLTRKINHKKLFYFINYLNFQKMKKKILGGIAMLAIAAVAVVNVNLNSQGHELSAISLANVEALAEDEDSENKKSCFKTVTEAPDDNSLAVSVRKCSSCSYCLGNSILGFK